MWRGTLATASFVAALSMTGRASAATPSPAPVAAASGLGVVALPGAADAAWPLARAVYADPLLRAPAVDDAHARVLCGDPPPAGAPPELRDLGDTVAAIRGDDAPSRVLLGEVARHFALRGLVVVQVSEGRASARVFVADAGFDAAVYAPDGASSAPSSTSWSGAVRSLDRAFGPPPVAPAGSPAPAMSATSAAPALATHEAPRVENGPPRQRHFYESVWFWGAIGGAALAGGALYFATRDGSSPTIHLDVQVPHP
jgi:hypothetical protein